MTTPTMPKDEKSNRLMKGECSAQWRGARIIVFSPAFELSFLRQEFEN
jgi:hypothetical protein